MIKLHSLHLLLANAVTLTMRNNYNNNNMKINFKLN